MKRLPRIALALMLLQAASIAAADVPVPGNFSANLAAPVSKKAALYIAGVPILGIKWTCAGSRCRGKGITSDVEEACKALQSRIGAIKSFIAKDRLLGARCQVLPIPE